ncbi:S8 family peptidase [Desmospora profundinema]|uniref:Subtilisin n=1 Tax=Desmospora profundinema TaxID=1571184 RepID=A0ABU1IM61_9BACL|nr:S8 family peptidase [Desmospora profundinema]MDR6225249.1 subtilisin [Desmospora profundinema]
MLPDWFPGPIPMYNRRPRVRKIIHLRQRRDLRGCIQELSRVGGRPVRVLPHLGVVIGEFLQTGDSYSLEGHPDVAHWEPDIQVTLSDPFVGEISRNIPSIPWGVQEIGAHKTWRYTKGRGVKVAVVDTGIANDHVAVQGNYKGGVNIISPMFTPYDYNGHGTHVAGIIAGRSEELGILGVAPRVHLYAVKAFNRRGSASLSDLLSAINWCIENRMDIINMSFGMVKVSDSLRQAIQTAYRRKIVMVAASGNQGSNGNIDYPARFDETIGVTATGKDGKLASFSNTGAGVDLAAPGDKITSCWLNGVTREMSGTSMAVPHVSGTAALLLYLKPDLSPDQLRQLFTQGGVPVSGHDGYRRLNAHHSVQLLARYMGRFIP